MWLQCKQIMEGDTKMITFLNLDTVNRIVLIPGKQEADVYFNTRPIGWKNSKGQVDSLETTITIEIIDKKAFAQKMKDLKLVVDEI